MLKKTISVVFILMLLAPAGLWLFTGFTAGVRREPPSVAFPQPDRHALFKNDYYRALDQYINDHFIFRDRVVFIKNWIDLNLFRKTERIDIHVGRNGWLYRRGDVENPIQDIGRGAGPTSRLLLELHALEKMIEASGRRFRLLVIPSKASIYPEYVGWVPLPARGRRAYDLFREAHQDHPLKNRVPLEAPLLARKGGPHLLYDPTASTWNGRGAAVAADALYQSLFKTPMPTPVMAAGDRHDDLERQVLGMSTAAPTAMVRHLTGLHAEGLGRCVVYGDAGIDPLLPHLLPMAQRLEVLSTGRIPSGRIEEDLRSFDSILIQTTETGIQNLRIDLDRVFDQLLDAATPVTYAPVDLTAVKPMANTALHHSDEGLEVKSLGARSTFAIIDLPGSYRRCLRVLRLTLSALLPDTMTVTYQTNPPIQVAKAIPPDRFNLYLPLPVRSTVTLRFQPGDYAGLLVVHDAKIIGFPEGDTAACGRPAIVAEDNSTRSMGDEMETDERPVDAGSEKPEIAATIMGPTTHVAVDGETTPHPTPPDASSRTPVTIEVRSASPGVEDASDEARKQAEVLPDNTPKTAQVPESVQAAKVSPTIVLSDFAEGRIFQRQNRQADIVVSGVYTGTVSGIEARVIRHGTVDAVVPWTVIDDAPDNGIFLGLLPGVPEGGWYALEVRATDDPTNWSTGQNRWGVGILMACIGQSNMKEWFFTGTDLTAHPLLRRYTDRGWHTLDGRGNGAIACGNRLIARTGVPVGLIEYAVNGSGLHRKADWGTGYWEDTRPDSIYRRFLSGVSATGGRLEFVLWIQGEADAARGTVTREDYQTALTRFVVRQVRRDIINGSTQPQLPFLVVAMVKRPGGRDAPHQAIRDAQQAVTEQVAECYLAATTLDLTNLGKQHLTPEAYTTMGHRVAQTALYILGMADFYRGPVVVAVRQNDERTLDVTLQHHGGTDILPETGITGWEIMDAAGAASIQNVFRHDPRTIRIRLERALQARAEIRYLYGAEPDARRALRDNASPGLPLEAFRGEVAPPSASHHRTPPETITP
jgi:Carbohydrate esterase, sialic acid-specific acetylesterase/SGNH hydrolase-like domain, acetyltransferase AlgX